MALDTACTPMNTTRRSLITGLIALVAAPAIVRAGSLMPVKAMIASEPSIQLIPPGLYVPPVWDGTPFKAAGCLIDGRLYWINSEMFEAVDCRLTR